MLKSNLDYIITVGKETIHIDAYLNKNNYTRVKHFNKESEVYSFIENLLEENDTVLFKGSNAIKIKNIVDYLMNK